MMEKRRYERRSTKAEIAVGQIVYVALMFQQQLDKLMGESTLAGHLLYTVWLFLA